MSNFWLRTGQVWSVLVAGVGVSKLVDCQLVKDEWETFGYPLATMRPSGVVDIACGVGCLTKARWGGPLMLFVTGAGVSVIFRRALLDDCPVFDRYLEIGSGIFETGGSCAAAVTTTSVSHGALLACFVTGVVAAYSLHIILGTSPTWRREP
eukprot:TRINITY_DN1784_c3_g1_i1.p1 TRINITY_DN1784_c3_g1~~TRINITY_DN1784_c3_g1_i1.p1  ORF type:complete len:152 (+),score=20.27 TRINITY_DN1784_c3_g1_i1:175-630(+)